MSGFRRAGKTSTSSNENISTGIKSLDEIVEIKANSVTAFLEDEYSFAHNTFLHLFVSSAFLNTKNFYILSSEEKNKIRYQKYEQEQKTSYNEQLTIAWRYKNLELGKETCNWDLMNKLELDNRFVLNSIEDLLEKIQICKDTYFVIYSMFAPLYGSYSSIQMQKILFDIKKYSRINNNTVYLSIPLFLYNSVQPFENACPMMNYFDNILAIHNNLLLPHETSLYSSILEVVKVSKLTSLHVNNLESRKFGVVVKSKSVLVEKIDIPPEDNQNSEGCATSF